MSDSLESWRPSHTFNLLVGLIAATAIIGYFVFLRPKFGSGQQSPRTAALTQISTFMTALECYRTDTGSYPEGTNTLLDLIQQPAGLTNWRGPYLRSIPKDPWGNDYIYRYPGTNPASGYPYDLYSLGSGDTNSIIANWALESMKPQR